jgi:hypothetical protein
MERWQIKRVGTVMEFQNKDVNLYSIEAIDVIIK